MKRWIVLVALLTLVGASAATAQPPPNIVANGDFEAPAVCPAVFATTPPAGWTLEAGTVDLVCFTFWEPASGLQSVDLTGTPGQGRISQNLVTESGEEYRLRFAMAGNPDSSCSTEDPNKRMAVRWGGTLVDTLTFTVTFQTFPPAFTMAWVYHEYTVEATGPLTELEFESLTGTFCGPTLDDVSVTQIDDDDGDGVDDDEDGEDEDGDGDDDDGDGDDDGDDDD
jgi:hypothetical protein